MLYLRLTLFADFVLANSLHTKGAELALDKCTTDGCYSVSGNKLYVPALGRRLNLLGLLFDL